ncbi:chemotaxis protein CheA [Deferrisoma camini]|uniref:chemotaxis protein CheA n=1 Tax=Deferrisoma camini TaxID=1035120 RepID=UPI00046CB485|nr:chemotaxis protein CheA [Deferrisoma camini]
MSGPDVSQALAGYFEEVAELLQAAQSALLSVENSVAEGDLDVPSLYTVYRAMHTIKGLSAMVEAHAAVRVAHGLETVLQDLHAREQAPSRALLDRLFEGVALLESLVDRFRSGEVEAPETEGFLDALARVRAAEEGTPSGAAAGPGESLPLPESVLRKLSGYEQRQALKRLAAGEGLYLLELAPDKDKVARGVSINAVRSTLEEAKELLAAVPLAEAGKGLRFLVAVMSARPLEEVLAPWKGDVTGRVLRPPAKPKPPPPKAERRPAPPAGPARDTIRVPAEKLDAMLRLVGELVVDKNRLWGALAQVDAGLPPRRLRNLLEERLRALDRTARDLRDAVTTARLVPAAELLQRVPLIAREAARVQRKEVRALLEGGEVEVDKAVVERLAEPLVHLIRNAVDHGIEPPAERERLGKPRVGTVRVACRSEGEEVVLTVADDGRGIDPETVRPRAEAMGLAAAGKPLTADQLIRVLCAPGFTTHRGADELGGRGVGMEAVWHGVTALGGSLALETRPGRGTTWTLRVPVTLTIGDVVLVRVGAETLAFPLAAVIEVLEAPELVRVERETLMRYRGREIPHVDLAEALGMPAAEAPAFPSAVITPGPRGPVGIGVGRMLGLREVVLRPLADPLVRTPGVEAVTDLGDGRGILVLDPRGVVGRLQGEG